MDHPLPSRRPFFFRGPPRTEFYTLSLHDALPISVDLTLFKTSIDLFNTLIAEALDGSKRVKADRKSTRLNSSHVSISYAVFCLKKKKARDLIFLFKQAQ